MLIASARMACVEDERQQRLQQHQAAHRPAGDHHSAVCAATAIVNEK
jgi:hypothetical protein